MDVLEIRRELHGVRRKDLLGLVSVQRISRCLVGGRSCRLNLCYKEFHFCLSEIVGKGCELEGIKKLEERYEDVKETNYPLPLRERAGSSPLKKEKRKVVFRVYRRNYATRSIILLGTVIERRSKERGNNLKDLLVRAIKDYSDCVKDPSMIFLCGT